MAQKFPKLFKPLFTEKDFEKKILKRIFLPEARKLVLSLYIQKEDGAYELKPEYLVPKLEIDKKIFKSIETLSKEIAKNSGWIDFSKLGLVGVVVAVVVIFYTVFLDSIVNNFVVNTLQQVFGARVEIGGLHLRPLEGKVYFSDLRIADKESPMNNLVTIKDGQVDINIGAIFGGSFLFNKVVAREMEFGTPREYSGALSSIPPHLQALAEIVPTAGTTEPAPEKDLFDIPLTELPFANLLTLTSQSPKELFAAEVSKLKAVQVIQAATETFRERVGFWQKRASDVQREVTGFGTNVRSIAGRDVRAIATLPELNTFLQQIKTAADLARTLGTTVSSSVTEIRVDSERVSTLKKDVTDAVEADWTMISNLVKLPEGGPVSWVSSLVMPEINRRYGGQVRLARQVWDIAQAIQASSDKKEVTPKPARVGQDFPFPKAVYPRFLLGKLEVSLGSREAKNLFEFILTDVSTQPDITSEPYVLTFTRLDQGQDLMVRAQADLRTGAPEPFAASTEISNEPFAISGPLESAGITSFEGTASWKASLGFPSGGGLRLDVETQIARPTLVWKEKGEITDLVDRILGSVNPMVVSLNFLSSGDKTEFAAATNLDEPARREITNWALGKIRVFEAGLRSELDSYLGTHLRDNQSALGDFTRAETLVNQNGTNMEGYKTELEKKQKEVEERIANFARDQVQQRLPGLPSLPF